jgi:dipeptidyl aminopeptidase/acylaminoacyl peptidase
MKHLCVFGALAFFLGLTQAQQPDQPSQFLVPNSHLKADGIDALPTSIAERVAPYTEFRGHGLVDWHPLVQTMLVRHREAGANTAQIFQLAKPGDNLQKLTDFPEPIAQASFNPVDGRYIIYARDSGGNEATQIYRMDLDTRLSTMLSLPNERSSARWTHKGRDLLISAVPLDKTATAGKRDAVVTSLTLLDPLKPESTRRFAELPGGGWGEFSFSSDDQQIAAVQYRTTSDSDVFLINARTGAVEKILPLAGTELAGFGDVQWSPDGKRLFLTTNQGGEFFELAAYDLSSKTLTRLSHHIPWDVESFSLSNDGKWVLAVVNHSGRDELRLFDAITGLELPRPNIPAGSISSVRWHKTDRASFAFSLNSSQSPGDVYSYDLNTGKARRWTTAYAAPGVNPGTFIDPELVQIKSFDGLPISAWLYLPDAGKFPGKRPVIVDFHGGPEGQSTVRFMGRWNYYLNEMGLAVLMPNVRGSTGYGKSFQNLDNGFQRKDSVKDGGAFLTWLGNHPRLNANRVVVSGGSYGGYMSLATAVDYSALLRGAIDVVGISNFTTFLKNTESYRRDLRRVEYGDERDPPMHAFMEQIAPLNNAKDIKVPLFIVQGKNDPRVPFTEAEQMVTAVRSNGTPVWYLLADNEGHGFARKINADFYFYCTVQFFTKTLLD